MCNILTATWVACYLSITLKSKKKIFSRKKRSCQKRGAKRATLRWWSCGISRMNIQLKESSYWVQDHW